MVALPPTACVYELDCSSPAVKKVTVLIRRKFVILFIVDNAVAHGH